MASIAQYFTLESALATAARISDAAREDLALALALGRQRAEAAEALWSNGHAVEGLRLAIEALEATCEAAPKYAVAVPVVGTSAAPLVTEAPTSGTGDETPDATGDEAASDVSAEAVSPAPAASLRDVLLARGVRAEVVSEVETALARARAATVPRLDREIGAAHTELYEALVRARLVVDRALGEAALTRRELGLTKAARIGAAALVVLLVLGGLVFALRTPVEIGAQASAVFANSPQFGADHVVDGRADSEWLLPDRSTGWVEARLSPPRNVRGITLLNAKNAPHFDRATREYRLELYAGGRVVRTIDGEFPEFDRDPSPVRHEVSESSVDRVRFVVRSHHNLGAGLAELTIEE